MATLSPKQWEDIHSFQAKEIERLCSDFAFTSAASKQPHYTRIGEWLPGQSGEKVLEVGCGPGRYVAMLSTLGYDVIGIDPCEFPAWDMIREQTTADLRSNLFAEELPFEDECFDHVACLGALLYFKDPEKSLSEIKRVLKPGGRLMMRTVNRTNLYWLINRQPIDPASTNHYSENEIRSLLEASGFTVDQTFTYGFYPPFFETYWWYLMNGPISIGFQEFLSTITPKRNRVNVVAFAAKPDK